MWAWSAPSIDLEASRAGQITARWKEAGSLLGTAFLQGWEFHCVARAYVIFVEGTPFDGRVYIKETLKEKKTLKHGKV